MFVHNMFSQSGFKQVFFYQDIHLQMFYILLDQKLFTILPHSLFNPFALRKAKILCNFGVSECNRINQCVFS